MLKYVFHGVNKDIMKTIDRWPFQENGVETSYLLFEAATGLLELICRDIDADEVELLLLSSQGVTYESKEEV